MRLSNFKLPICVGVSGAVPSICCPLFYECTAALAAAVLKLARLFTSGEAPSSLGPAIRSNGPNNQ